MLIAETKVKIPALPREGRDNLKRVLWLSRLAIRKSAKVAEYDKVRIVDATAADRDLLAVR